jgi:glutaredoxin-like protein
LIPLREQEAIRQRFQGELKSRVRIDLFSQKPSRIYIPGRQECPHCEDVKTMLEEMASLSNRVALTVHEFAQEKTLATSVGVDKVPAIVIRGQANRPVRFFGMPYGNQFPLFIETIIEAASGSAELAPETARQLKKVRSDVHLQVFVEPTGPHCPALAATVFKFGLMNPKVRADVIEIAEFPQLAQSLGVRAVPTTLINESVSIEGALTESEVLQRVFQVLEGKPLSAAQVRGGASTPFTLPAQQQQAPRQASSGLILPR